jgi:hypothetical protein
MYSIEASSASYLGVIQVSRNASAQSSNPILGAEGVSEGGSASQSFVSGIASQGLKWDADCLCFLTQTDMTTMANAGINVLGLIGPPGTPETSCGSGVLQSESTYKAAVQHVVAQYPTIHNWEYGLEVETPCYNPPSSYDQGWNISPQHYLIGLVWAYEAVTSMAGHASDTFQGPGETIWTTNNGAANASCYNTFQMNWFKSLWSQSYTDPNNGITYTPNSVLTYLDLDVYTQNMQWTDVLGTAYAGTCASMTVSQMLTIALNDYHSISGKTIWIFGTGFPPNTGGGLSAQSQWYKGMVPFYQSLGYVGAVFAYCLYGCNEALFSSPNLADAYPAWSVYQSYISSSSTITPSSTALNCNPSSIASSGGSSTTTCTVNITGNSPTGTVSFSSSSSTGIFSTSSCALSGASCSVTYYDSSSGAPTITASYSGDTNNQISSGTFQEIVAGTTSSSTTSTSSSTQVSHGSSSSTSTTGEASSYLQTSSTQSGSSQSPSNVGSGAASQSNPVTGILSALSPSKDPPLAYGFATYEIPLILALGYVMNRTRGGQRKNARAGDWHW